MQSVTVSVYLASLQIDSMLVYLCSEHISIAVASVDSGVIDPKKMNLYRSVWIEERHQLVQHHRALIYYCID